MTQQLPVVFNFDVKETKSVFKVGLNLRWGAGSGGRAVLIATIQTVCKTKAPLNAGLLTF